MLAGAGLGALMYGVSEGPGRGWDTAPVLATVAAGIVILAVLVRVELVSSHPIIDLRLWGNRLFRSCTAVMVLVSVAFLGSLYLVSLFYQDAKRAGVTIPAQTGFLRPTSSVSRLASRFV